MPSYEKYAAIRDKKGVSDYQVWKDTGIATATLSDWKNGISKPKTDKLMILANYFGVGIEELLEQVKFTLKTKYRQLFFIVKTRGDDYMNKPIIDIPRASESTIRALVNAGILEVTEDGIKVAK